MPPKKSGLSRSSRTASATRKRRSQETNTQTEERLLQERDRWRKRATNETDYEREQRLECKKRRVVKKRDKETEVQHTQRLAGLRQTASTSRQNETEAQRTQRLAGLRQTASTSRQNETEAQRTQRLAGLRQTASTSRQNETEAQHTQRLAGLRQTASTSRQNETEAQRTQRLAGLRQTASTSRQNETETQRTQRLAGLRQTASTSRQNETETQRQQRLTDQRVHRVRQKRHGSIFQKARQAFDYNPGLDYKNDKLVKLNSPVKLCKHCQSLNFEAEPAGMCCSNGKVVLPAPEELPQILTELLQGETERSQHFLNNTRKYNSAFQMTSFGADRQIVEPGFMPTFKIQGQVYHCIGSLLPSPGEIAKFLQIYFVGDHGQEAQMRINTFENLNADVIQNLQTMLNEKNHLIQQFRTAIENVPVNSTDHQIVIRADKRPQGEHERRYNAPVNKDVGVLIVGEAHNRRDIILHMRNNTLQKVPETHRSYDALQYPLIYWQGQDGYHFSIPQTNPVTGEEMPNKTVSANDFYAYRLMSRQDQFNPLLHFRELLSQFVVDMYAKIEAERLRYIRLNQKQLRVESYAHLQDALATDVDPQNLGQLVILPSTHTGSPRYMHEKTQDAMAYVRKFGKPDLFITFTCNSKWPEITELLSHGQKGHHRHDVVARVFRQKLIKLINLLTKHCVYGTTQCHMYTVEWQKRGLPHAHILLWLKQKIRPNEIDSIISAEIPDKNVDEELHGIVVSNMMHGPCGRFNPQATCMKDEKCTRHFPRKLLQETQTGEDGYPLYRRRKPEDGGSQVKVKVKGQEVTVDNRWVVPYSPLLCKTFNAHINVEFCNSIKSIKYVCKYVNKGSDMAVFGVPNPNHNDEINNYLTARYVSSNEAVWRIFNFPIHERAPAVVHLAVHLENGQRVYFDPENPQQLRDTLAAPKETTLTAFYKLCQSDDFAKTLLYNQVPEYYTWMNQDKKWKRRAVGEDVDGHEGIKHGDAIGRVYAVNPRNFGCFHLRMLLHSVRGPTSFEALRTVDGRLCSTYKEACMSMGLLEDDQHWNNTLAEAAATSSSAQLRSLFAIMFLYCDLTNPVELWETHRESMSEDIAYQHQMIVGDPMDEALHYDENVFNQALKFLKEKVMSMGGKSLTECDMPEPTVDSNEEIPYEMRRETSFNTGFLKTKVQTELPKLLDEQRFAFEQVMGSIDNNRGTLFFLDAPGGTGKTFLLNLILANVRKDQRIAIAVASSGIAATLLAGGRTAHSMFKLPRDMTGSPETITCHFGRGSNTAKVLQQTSLIVFDECTMAHSKALEAVNRTIQDVRQNDLTMGGITFVLAGDFRQILPVVERGTRADEVQACLKSSVLWTNVKTLHLKTNMRAQINGEGNADNFARKLLDVGEGKLMENTEIGLHELKCGIMTADLEELIARVFPDITNNFLDTEWLCERAILAPTNEAVDRINKNLLEQCPGETITSTSVDVVIEEEEAVNYPVEFLNSIQPSGFPPHVLELKPSCPIILLRNLDPPKLCNGTRLVVKKLNSHVLEATILTGTYKGEGVFIPRIPFIPNDLPYRFKRKQFPVRLCFAMSINKSQGQTMKVVGLNLTNHCFAHGQLYVGCSRVGLEENLHICTSTLGMTKNIVYPEVLS